MKYRIVVPSKEGNELVGSEASMYWRAVISWVTWLVVEGEEAAKRECAALPRFVAAPLAGLHPYVGSYTDEGWNGQGAVSWKPVLL